MNVVAYLRVSTAAQAEEGLGLEVQTAAIEEWAAARHWDVLEYRVDEAVSGASELEDRPGLGDALDDLERDDVQGLVVYRLDRLARDLVVQEAILARVWRLDRNCFSTFEGETAYLTDDAADPSRRLVRQVMGAVAEYERALIRLRLAAGRRRKHERGGYAYGAPPFGTRAEGGELVPVPEEQRTLAKIRALRAEGWGYQRIADWLNDRDVVARRGRWHSTTVARALGVKYRASAS